MSLRLEAQFGEALLLAPARIGRRKFGVPPGGSWDTEAASLVRVLADLPTDAPVWELTNAEAVLTADEDGSIALAGARTVVEIDGAPHQTPGRFALRAGVRARVRAPRTGWRVALAWSAGARPELRLNTPEPPGPLVLRVVPGPHARLLGIEPVGERRSANDCDRVGVRFEPRSAEHGVELTSEPAVPGVIQVTPAGQWILLGPEGPTIGGYPKIGVVCAADFSLAAQIRPDQRVVFEPIGLDQARAAAVARRAQTLRRIAVLALTAS